MKFTTEQYRAAVEALGLNPDRVQSVYLDPGWARIVHANGAVTSVPLEAAAPTADAD